MELESLIIQRLLEVSDAIDLDTSNLTPIQEFYKDAKIFVTGATGLLGQLLLEKLLRSCPVSTIYVLIRDKKGKDVDTRLNELFDDVLYKRLRKVDPNFQEKIKAIVGDCALPNLGISDRDREVLIEEVDVVFHIAATVRFDEKLGKAAAVNVRGTRDLSRILQQMSKLKSFVHVSTAYSNCIHGVIEEKVYPTAKSYHELLLLTESLDDVILEKLTPQFIGKYPNTYVYSKQIGEDVIKQETKGLPCGIYRPSIVASTYKEPIRAWINNFYGVVGVSYGAGLGLLRVLQAESQNDANIVPADMCVHGLIASAWDVAERFQKCKARSEQFDLPVYNFESSNDRPIKWANIRSWAQKYGRMVPAVKCLWVDFLVLVKSNMMYILMTFLLHTIPAAIIDLVLFCRGKKMRMLDAYKKIHNFSGVVSYFSLTNFKFKSFNVQKMIANMSDRDRDIFLCDLRKLDWEEFMSTYLAGCRIYLLKEPLDTLPQAKKRMKRIAWIHKGIMLVLGLSFITILWLTLSGIYNLVM